MYNSLVLEATYRGAAAVREVLVQRDEAEVTVDDVAGVIPLLVGFGPLLRDVWEQLESRLRQGAEVGRFVLVADKLAETMALWLDTAARVQRWGTKLDLLKRGEKVVSALQSLAAGEKELAQVLLALNRVRELARTHKPHPPAEIVERALQGRALKLSEVRARLHQEA
jgi:hypothetical protein